MKQKELLSKEKEQKLMMQLQENATHFQEIKAQNES